MIQDMNHEYIIIIIIQNFSRFTSNLEVRNVNILDRVYWDESKID